MEQGGLCQPATRAYPANVFSQGAHETVGATGAGKAQNLQKLGMDVVLHGLIGEDAYGRYRSLLFRFVKHIQRKIPVLRRAIWQAMHGKDVGDRLHLVQNAHQLPRAHNLYAQDHMLLSLA